MFPGVREMKHQTSVHPRIQAEVEKQEVVLELKLVKDLRSFLHQSETTSSRKGSCSVHAVWKRL